MSSLTITPAPINVSTGVGTTQTVNVTLTPTVDEVSVFSVLLQGDKSFTLADGNMQPLPLKADTDPAEFGASEVLTKPRVLTLTFKPTATGPVTGLLTVFLNGRGGAEVVSATINGTGV